MICSEQLIGHQVMWQKLQGIIQKERFPHCSLLHSAPGSDNLTMALAVAQTLLCLHKEIAPCGTCSACVKVNHITHPDLHFTFPLAGAGEKSVEWYNQWRTAVQENPHMEIADWMVYCDKEGKQANINKDEVLSIIQRLQLKPFESDCQVHIIWLAEYFGKEGNKLLKLLEEPPGKMYIILLATDLQLILPTILSRTQLFSLATLDDNEILNRLKQDFPDSQKAWEMATLLSEGNYNIAKSFITQGQMGSDALLRGMLNCAYKKDPVMILKWVEEFASLNKEDQKYFFIFASKVLSQCLKIKWIPEDQLNVVEKEWIKIASKLDVEQIDQLKNEFDNSYFATLRNGNVKIQMTNAILNTHNILFKQEVPLVY